MNNVVDHEARQWIRAVEGETKVLAKGHSAMEKRFDDHLRQNEIFETAVRASLNNISEKMDRGYKDVSDKIDTFSSKVNQRIDTLIRSALIGSLAMSATLIGYLWVTQVGGG